MFPLDQEKVRAEDADLSPAGAVVVAKVDVVDFGVGEVDTPGGQVERQAVGPVDLAGDDGRAARAVHVDALDARVVAPVGPEQDTRAGRRVERDTARLLDICKRRSEKQQQQQQQQQISARTLVKR